MILIDTATLVLHSFPSCDQRYAILSHTWGPAAEEVTYQEMIAPTRSESTITKPGYQKIKKTCEIARSNYNLPWAWIDTCCIDKTSSADLSEAINSMFRWYREAWVCFAYLSDMDEDPSAFLHSRWFSRGWTLQELIAPKYLIFFDCGWTFRGTKTTMTTSISSITGIPSEILDNSVELDEIPVAVRLSWASRRETTRSEDLAYCLLGIFDVNMPMLYGEGPKAFARLQEAILSQSADMSLFLWTDLQTSQQYTGLLATAPVCFREMRLAKAEPSFTQREYYPTNRGIRLKLGLAWDPTTGLAILPLKHSIGNNGKSVGVYLRRVGLDQFVRAQPQEHCLVKTEKAYAVFTVAKSVTKSQSDAILSNVLKISVPRDIYVEKEEPRGSWDPENGLLHASYTGTFLGFMKFESANYRPFTLVCCFQNRHWSTSVVSGERWQEIKSTFYPYYKENFGLLTQEDRARFTEIGYIDASNKTKGISIRFRGGSSTEPPSILMRTVDAMRSTPQVFF
ncbi:HET-domain-containing protein [Cucurbitaria berberidis CBS 394.84]|uniref:HET-domain-containing protein n=1 Tax=Cucurbitaria berberidis CBS 394.84 TaxID=1168544 RepID=A0A9P4GJ83_9PLEO|nr:HET-domain-containing protein [Cucurbitaria berberidis CBS 394.84]KAF1846406.1 HET-domain-containing protein [Cucurbitaria berberidis CBS 394.84]